MSRIQTGEQALQSSTQPSINILKNHLDVFWHVHRFEQSDDFPRTRTNTSPDQLTGY